MFIGTRLGPYQILFAPGAGATDDVHKGRHGAAKHSAGQTGSE